MKILLVFISVLLLFSSCATVFGGEITNCQKSKPKRNQPARSIREVAFAFDLLFPPALWVDFSNCKIYKPCSVVRTSIASR